MLDSLLTFWVILFGLISIFFVVFAVVERLAPCNPNQPYLRGGITTDLLYAFINPVFNRVTSAVTIGALSALVFFNESPEKIEHYLTYGYGFVGELPIWLQMALYFFVADFLLYWIHRAFHTPLLWKFHAIHHSSEELNWLSTYRFHPINTWFAFVFVDALMIIIGISPAAIAALGLFNMVYSAFVHSNLKWDFGEWGELFASPVFHRWHHTSVEEGGSKNFAPTFPFIDIMFGTYYRPTDRLPEKYGVSHENFPKDYIGQLLWPFKRER